MKILRKLPIGTSPTMVYLWIAIPIFLWISWSALYFPLSTYSWYTDYWEHSAAIHEWKKDLLNPMNPHLAIETGSPRYMPFFFVLTVVAKLFDLAPIQALGLGGIINFGLFLGGVFLFFRLYFRNNWAPVVGLIVLLTGWGVGWAWSNLYQLRGLFFIVAYPSIFVFALIFFALWLATRILRQQKRSIWAYVSLGGLIAIMFVSHPLTGAFAIGSLFILALLEPKVPVFNRYKLIGVVVAGALVAELWPYFSVWKTVLGTSGGEAASWMETGHFNVERTKRLYSGHVFYKTQQVLVTLGPALLGIPALLYLAYRRQHLFIVGGAMVMGLPYLANLVFPIPLGHRFLLFAVFYLHLSLTWAVLHSQSRRRSVLEEHPSFRAAKMQTSVVLGLLILFLGWNVTLAALEFGGYRLMPDLRLRKRYSSLQPVVSDMRRISHFIPDDGIVLAPSPFGWPLPTFVGKVVSMYHPNPMVPDLKARSRDTKRFFQAETRKNERLHILQHYRVTHVLYKRSDTAQRVIDFLNEIGSVSGIVKNYIIVELSSYNNR